MSLRKKKNESFQAAIHLLLNDHKHQYTQSALAAKLRYMGHQVSNSLLNKAINGQSISDKSLWAITEGLMVIVKNEKGLVFDEVAQEFVQLETDWSPGIIPIAANVPDTETHPQYLFHQDGRLSIQDKVKFISQATKDVAFLGVRLNQFTQYFYTRRDGEFKDHIEMLLQKGVNVYCYLVNPNTNAAKFYFSNRSRSLKDEQYGETSLPTIIEKLAQIQKGFREKDHKGQMYIYLLEQMPDAYFTIIDQNSERAQLMVSSYLQGVPRSKTPVVEVKRIHNPKLFSVYLTAFQSVTKGAKEYVGQFSG